MSLRVWCIWAYFAAQAGAQSGYVGSKICAQCHPAIASTYFQTPMGRSMGRAGTSAQLDLVLTPSVVGRFRVYRRGNEMYQSEAESESSPSTAGQSAYMLEYVLGSGKNGYGYIVKRDGRLVEAPLSFYTRSGKWDLSPGYDAAGPGFERLITTDCLNCHSGRPQPVANRRGMYLDPPFVELSIGCENCHGPGRDHAASRGRVSILNPGRLGPRESEAVCVKCHQSDEASAHSDLLAHDSSLRRSRCYRQSNGSLTCTTCHDPHREIAANVSAAYFRAKCLTCHTEASCRAKREERGPGDDCAGCHMSKRKVPEVPHAVLTNHHIQVLRK